MASTKLFVANLSSRVENRDLKEKFEKYGKVVEIKIREGRDGDAFGFVEYEDVEDAKTAFDKMQGYEMFRKKLRIEYSKPRGSRNESSNKNSNVSKENTECFVCKEKGHWASDCPDRAGEGNKKGTCFSCGSTRHKMRDCPKKRSGSRSRSRSRSRSGRRDGRRRDSRDRKDRRRSRSRDRRSRSKDRRSRDRNSGRRDRSRDRRDDKNGGKSDRKNRSRSRGSRSNEKGGRKRRGSNSRERSKSRDRS